VSLRKEFLYGFIIPSILLSTGAVAMDQAKLDKDAALLGATPKASTAPLVVAQPPIVMGGNSTLPTLLAKDADVLGSGGLQTKLSTATSSSAAVSIGGKGGLAPKPKAKKHATRQDKDGSGSDEEGQKFPATWGGAKQHDSGDEDCGDAAAGGSGMPVLDDESSASDDEAKEKHRKEHRKEKKEHKKERRHSSSSDEEESGFPCVEDDDCASPKKGHRDRSSVRGKKSGGDACDNGDVWAMLSGLVAHGTSARFPVPSAATVLCPDDGKTLRASKTVRSKEDKEEAAVLAQLLAASAKTNALLEALIAKIK